MACLSMMPPEALAPCIISAQTEHAVDPSKLFLGLLAWAQYKSVTLEEICLIEYSVSKTGGLDSSLGVFEKPKTSISGLT